MNIIAGIGISLSLAGIAGIASIYNFKDNIYFNPDKEIRNTPDKINLDYEDLFLDEKDTNNILNGWYIKSNSNSPSHVVLFCNGNAGNMSNRLQHAYIFHHLGFDTLLFDYKGFGNSTGISTENSIIKNTELFLNFLLEDKKINIKNIIMYGESIGCYPAATIANKYDIKYLVIQSGFTSMPKLINDLLPPTLSTIPKYLSDEFNVKKQLNIRHLKNQIKKNFKTLILHSKEDELIPINHALENKKYASDYKEITGKHCEPDLSLIMEYIYHLIKE